MALCRRPLTVWCACYLVSCVLHLVSVPVSKTFVICTCVVLFYFLLAMMGYTLPVLYQVILRVIRGKNLPGGRGGTGALSDNT